MMRAVGRSLSPYLIVGNDVAIFIGWVASSVVPGVSHSPNVGSSPARRPGTKIASCDSSVRKTSNRTPSRNLSS
eukprot:31041-Pelagococcus_subviridis.AAC.2